MLRPKTILDLLDDLAPDVQAAFIQSIQDIRSDAQLNVMIAALEAGDINAAMAALNIDAAYLAPMDQALTQAYREGGDWTVEGIRNVARSQGATVIARFDGRNTRAETFLRDRSSTLISEVVDDTVDGVRAILTQNMTDGVSPRKAALDVVGRLNRSTGTREGGLIGLTKQEMEYAENAYRQLVSGDRTELQKYLDRTARNGRFDSIVRRAIADGKPVSVADATRMTQAYRSRLLVKRGERIARTELLGSLHASQSEATQQLIDAGKIMADQVTEEWDSSEDSATRDSHRAAEGQVRPVGGTFTIGGFAMKYPGDSSLGAPASEIIQCRCRVRQSFDFISGL